LPHSLPAFLVVGLASGAIDIQGNHGESAAAIAVDPRVPKKQRDAMAEADPAIRRTGLFATVWGENGT
jgi:hypothetical protein